MDNNGYQSPLYDAVHPPPQQHLTAPPVFVIGAPGAGHALPAPPSPSEKYRIHGNKVDPTVITGQPQVVYMTPPQIPEQEAPDHLVMAILVTVFCCVPLGIVAVIKSSECRSARARGDRVNAIDNSRQAKKFSLIGLALGIVILAVLGAAYGIIIGFALIR